MTTTSRAAVLSAWLALGLPTRVWALVGDRDEGLGVDGSFRSVLAATRNYDAPWLFGEGNSSDGFGQAILRLVVGGKPLSWLSYEAHGVSALSIDTSPTVTGTALGGGLFGADYSTSYRLAPLRARSNEGGNGDVVASAVVDRLSLKIITSAADVTVGRQAVTFGKAYFWNPLDVFFAFGATELDRDYKPGVDAVRLDLPFGDFTGATLVGAASDVRRGDALAHAALVGRVYTTLGGWDLTLQGGKREHGELVGAGFAGEIASIEVRGEGALFFNPDHAEIGERQRPFVGVIGLGRRFESTLHLQLEHLYNDAARRDLMASFALVQAGRIQQAARNVTGALFSYEVLPVLTGSLAALYAWDDASFAIQPGLSYSAADEVDVVAGALMTFGERPPETPSLANAGLLQSEFGSYPDFLYVETKVYF